MDKNTITAFVLIALLLIGFSYFSRPNAEQIAAMQHYNDSIAAVYQQEEATREKLTAALANEKPQGSSDSTALFFAASTGTEQIVTLGNSVLELKLTTLGGRPASVILKDYNDQQGNPLELFNQQETGFNFNFYNRQGIFGTENYYFEIVDPTPTSVTLRLVADSASHIDFHYALQPESYLVDFTIQATGMADKLLANTRHVEIEWSQQTHQQEKGFTYENRLSKLYYKNAGNSTDNLSEGKAEEKSLAQDLDWIGFKNQFFSSVFIADQDFRKATVTSLPQQRESGYIKFYAAEMNTFFDPTGEQATSMHFYFGPNHYKTLKSFDKGKARADRWELDNLIYLGWPGVRWINKIITINVFDWLSSWGLHMGLVLLILTILVKIAVFPATWKTYMSSARMRVLKPQIDEINQKYPKQEDAMKKQQEVMGLYSQYGVSPMGGCLPMLLQFPILMALFMFVPSAIELRQQSFLWVDDLSTYDAFITFPFHIPFLGSHLSLFCVLMTVTNILNTRYTMAQQDNGAQPQMAAMKWMMYFMPVMFLFILNEFPSGLNYYYFISTLISVITMIVLRKTTDEHKLLADMEARRAARPQKKKSGFAARLEAMQKEQERLMEERNKQQGKK